MRTSHDGIRRFQRGIWYLLVVAFLAVSIFGMVSWLSYHEPWREPKFRTVAEMLARERQDLIAEELSLLRNHEWAGEYYCGDGLGVNCYLQLSPKAGFVFHWRGCLGLYDRNYGSVHLLDGVLKLQPAFDNTQGFIRGMPTELIPVRWGDRRYLVPPGAMANFCHAVNECLEPRDDVHGRFLLRWGDSERQVEGFPSVPREFQHLLEEVEFLPSSGDRAFEQMLADASKELLPDPSLILPADYESQFLRVECEIEYCPNGRSEPFDVCQPSNGKVEP